MVRVKRRGAAAVVAALATVVAIAGSPSTAARAQTPVVDRDWATEVLGDPWDFSNPEDALLAHGPPVSVNVHSARLHDGVFEWVGDVGFLDLLPMTIPGALPDSRDGRWNPVDADTWTHVSMRLYSSREQAFRVGWFTCPEYNDRCFRYHDFRVGAGWQTITLPMRQRSSHWRGDLLGIRLASGAGETTFRLDWLRIHTADASPTPVDGAPQPRVLTPNAAGGDDFATVVLGNPWDFSDAGDVVATGNVVDARLEDGTFHGTNGGPVQNDPHVVLPHGPGVDPDRYHLLTVSTTYDGPFSLEDAPGGGAHGRLLFRRADFGPAWVDGRELVTFPSRPTVTYDLKDGRFGSTVEPGERSWTGSLVTGLRWDPNEDRGARRWRVDEIRLAAPHESSGLFEVAWADRAHVDGTTVEVGVSRTRGDVSGTPLVSGLVQRPGENRVRLDLSGLRPGEWWVWVRATSPSGVTAASTASGPLVATGRVAGPDRVATGLALSELGWPDGADAVAVASARAFPDALAGVQLADAVDGPLLLVEPGGLGDDVADELRRLDPSEVLVLGGPAAIDHGVVEAVRATLPDADTRRVAGADRFDTAARIADLAERRWRAAGLEVADRVVLASGEAFPDALAAGPLVAATRTPLLLTRADALPDATRAALDDRPEADVLVVGGPTAVAPGVADATGRRVERIHGPDRFETARRLAEAAVSAGADPARTVVASGETFPDALGAGAWTARTGDVLLLTGAGTTPPPTEAWLSRADVQRALVVGGPAAVVQSVVDRIHDLARG